MDLSGNDQDGVVLKFRFPDIMLPDSDISEPASHGFIQFSVSQKADNPLGTVIENTAGIYFDFNEPVITNTVKHEVGENFIVINEVKTPIKSITPSIAISPNPHHWRGGFETAIAPFGHIGNVVNGRKRPTLADGAVHWF